MATAHRLRMIEKGLAPPLAKPELKASAAKAATPAAKKAPAKKK